MRCVRLNLPFPPSANDYWEVVPNPPRIIVTKRARIYKKALALTHGQLKPMLGPVRVCHFNAFVPDERCDLDNCFKVVFDALQGIAWVNDNQIKRIDRVEWWLDKRYPRLEIEFEEYARPDLPHQPALPITPVDPRKPTPSYFPSWKPPSKRGKEE